MIVDGWINVLGTPKDYLRSCQKINLTDYALLITDRKSFKMSAPLPPLKPLYNYRTEISDTTYACAAKTH